MIWVGTFSCVVALHRAEVPIEAVAEDENLLALEEGGTEEGAPLDSLDAEEAAAAAGAGGKPRKARKKPPKQAAAAAKENTPPKQATAAAAALQSAMGSLEYEALTQEAAAKGYGKLYAVFGGGLEGLRACAAGARTCPCAEFSLFMPCATLCRLGRKHDSRGSWLGSLHTLVTARKNLHAMRSCGPHLLLFCITAGALSGTGVVRVPKRQFLVSCLFADLSDHTAAKARLTVLRGLRCSGRAVRGERGRHAAVQLHPAAAGRCNRHHCARRGHRRASFGRGYWRANTGARALQPQHQH
jgi:hypothetical protein